MGYIDGYSCYGAYYVPNGVDPDGFRVSYLPPSKSNKCTATVALFIDVIIMGLTYKETPSKDAIKERIRTSIEDGWNGHKVDGCTIRFSVYVRVYDKRTEIPIEKFPNSVVELFGPDVNMRDHNWEGPGRGEGQWKWRPQKTEKGKQDVYAHEGGHGFGLIDRYHDVVDPKTKKVVGYTVDKGYEGNIMADGTAVQIADLRQILQHANGGKAFVCPCECSESTESTGGTKP